MNKKSDLRAYLSALFEAPLYVAFVVLDIVAIVAVIRWVVDDLDELLVIAIFLVIVHGGHYLIFKKQRATIAHYINRIAEIEDARPRPALSFRHDDQVLEYLALSVPTLPEEPDYEELVSLEARKLESAFQESSGRGAPLDIENLARLMQQALYVRRKSEEEYQEECADYLKDYREHLHNLYNHKLVTARLRSVGFHIENSGRVPAEDVFVFIDFADEFRFPSEEQLVELELLREPPEAPARPRASISMLETISSLASLRYPTFADQISMLPIHTPASGLSNVRGPFTKHRDSTEVSYEISKLMHGFAVDLDEVQFFVTEDAIGHSWELRHTIHSANLPNRIEGSLLLEVRVS